MAETFSTGRDLGEEQSSSVSKEGQLESDSDLNFGGLKQGLAEDPNGVTSACPPPHTPGGITWWLALRVPRFSPEKKRGERREDRKEERREKRGEKKEERREEGQEVREGRGERREERAEKRDRREERGEKREVIKTGEEG